MRKHNKKNVDDLQKSLGSNFFMIQNKGHILIYLHLKNERIESNFKIEFFKESKYKVRKSNFLSVFNVFSNFSLILLKALKRIKQTQQ